MIYVSRDDIEAHEAAIQEVAEDEMGKKGSQ